ncbi:beta-galactosidase [Clostridioides difficile]|nr:beta-galactosidase [Clostridioides difficile]
MRKEFKYAAGYYPLMQDRNDWEKDLKTMKDCGINLIRTAELFNTWDRIEPEEGKFEFKFLDDFFDLCDKYQIKILLGTGTASPPYWIHEKYPDVNIVNNHNEQYPNNVSYSWACIDNPGYIKESKKYIEILVDRYKNHNALYAYQIHNEISFPFMPLRDGDVDLYCYCEYSIEKFRSWVKNKYKTLDNLNYAYRWGATNIVHTSWNQVIPPRTKITSWLSVTRWLDWRLFWMENIVNFISWQNKIIKELDNKHITTTNIFFLKSQDPLGVLTALDQFEMSKVVDIIGYDLYPDSGDKLESMCEFSSMFLEMARSTSKSLNKDFWLLETDSGPINGWVLGPSRNVNGNDIFRNIFEAIGHDSKLTLYQGFRQWDFQPIYWGGLVDLDGNHTDLTKAAAKIGKIVNENSTFIMSSKTPKAKIAILLSKENSIILNGMGQEQFLIKALRGAYRNFWEKNYIVDFITPELVKEGYIKNYSLVYMPFMTCIDKDLAESLSAYVEKGGNLIGTARCGMLGEYGWYNHFVPCHSLSSTFGVKVEEVDSNVNPKISYKMKTYKGYWHKEKINVICKDVKVIARYNDDNPAVTINKKGKGHAIYFGTHPEVAYIEEKSELLWDILNDILHNLNMCPTVEVNYTNRYEKEIDVHYLYNEQEGMLLITNYVNKKHIDFFNNDKKRVEIKIETTHYYKKAIDVDSGEAIKLDKKDGKVYIEATIEKNKVKLIKLI